MSWHSFASLIVITAMASSACTKSSPADPVKKTVPDGTVAVRRGDFNRTVRLTGGVRAVESFAVLAPRLSGQMRGTGNMVITKIVKNGTRVREGD